ncbi:MAG: hypothetical protein NVS3B10_24120 [Polyangiales bacterium]
MDVDTCRQLIEELLSSYVDGELDNATAQSLELHLQMCPPCAAFLRTFTATKRCVRAESVAQMPSDCEASLWSFLQRELGDSAVGLPVGAPKSATAGGCGCPLAPAAGSPSASAGKPADSAKGDAEKG